MKTILITFILATGFSTIVSPLLFDRGEPADSTYLSFLILLLFAALIMIWNPIFKRDRKNQTTDRRCPFYERRIAISKYYKAAYDRRNRMVDRRQGA